MIENMSSEDTNNKNSNEQSEHKQADSEVLKPDAGVEGAVVEGEDVAVGTDSDSGVDIEALQKDLTQEKEKSENFQNQYLRSRADLENFRRRAEKERSDFYKYCNEDVLSDFLPVLDSLAKACPEDDELDENNSYQQGMLLVKRQIFDVLQKAGLKEIEAKGQQFDPNLHQGIQRIESEEVSEEKVLDVFATGYLYKDRLLRPSMVSVAVPTEKKK